MPPTLIDAKSAAARCGVSSATVRRLANAGEIPGAARVGSVWRFDPDQLDDWLLAGASAAPSSAA